MKNMKVNYTNNNNYIYMNNLKSSNKNNLTKSSKNSNINSIRFKNLIRLNNEKVYNYYPILNLHLKVKNHLRRYKNNYWFMVIII